MKKILYILNIANRVNNFSEASMLAAQELGYEFHIAGNWGYKTDAERTADEEKYGIKIFQVDFIRSPYDLRNIKAYKQIVSIMKEGQYDIVHCNTPIGGIVGRIAAKRTKVKNVIYQAHGFHFYKGAPLKNWLLYYPVERWFAHYTDVIITINQEDYERTKKFKLRNAGKVYYVPGVGIDTSQYQTDRQYRIKKRSELGLKADDVALISMGDLIERKNYPVAIEAIAKAENPKLQYYICGTGPEKEKLITLAKSRGVEKQIHFLGYRNDIKDLLQAADIFIFTTLQEGLSRSLMEAMASGLPCIASKIRGNTDLMNDSNGGILCESIDDYVEAIDKLTSDPDLRKQMSINNLKAILHYSVDEVSQNIRDVYTTGGG
jgi:hypothetical protein